MILVYSWIYQQCRLQSTYINRRNDLFIPLQRAYFNGLNRSSPTSLILIPRVVCKGLLLNASFVVVTWALTVTCLSPFSLSGILYLTTPVGESFIKIYSKRTGLISSPVCPPLCQILEIAPVVEIVEEFQTYKFYK